MRTNPAVTVMIRERTVLSVQAVQRSYKEDNWGNQVQFCTEVCEENTQNGEAIQTGLQRGS
jgi:hypothetical protein